MEVATEVHRDSFEVFGALEMWHMLKREAEQAGRDGDARRMRPAGVPGVPRCSRVRQAPAQVEVRLLDRIRSSCVCDAPSLVWVASFTHLAPAMGCCASRSSSRVLAAHPRVHGGGRQHGRARHPHAVADCKRRCTANVGFIAERVITHSEAGSLIGFKRSSHTRLRRRGQRRSSGNADRHCVRRVLRCGAAG